MPWKETNKMEQKELFIEEMLKKDKPFKHLCAQFGISEKTGYKWKNRFYEMGKAGLEEESRNPSHSNQIDGDTAAELIRIKNAHSAWGPKKIRVIYAKAYPNKAVPSLSSVKRILKKAGLVEKRKIRKPASSDCPRLQQQIQASEPIHAFNSKYRLRSLTTFGALTLRAGGSQTERFVNRLPCAINCLGKYSAHS